MRALWRLTRPTGAFFVSLVPLIGYGFAHWDRALTARNPEALLPLLVAWWFLNAGTLWLNAALDKDEGEILFGSATHVPPVTPVMGRIALLVCIALASLASWEAGLCALACAILAVLYSHPRTIWKGHPVFGPLVNVLGYGLLSPLAGWMIVGVPLTWRGGVTLALLMWWTLGWYFAAQAFQREEDAARGYRTLVVLVGPQRTVKIAWGCLAISVLGFVGLAVIGWYPRIILGSLPAFLGGHLVFREWSRLADGGSAAWAMRVVRWTIAAGIAMLCLAYAEYFQSSYRREPVAGLATVGGHPPDRLLPPPVAIPPLPPVDVD